MASDKGAAGAASAEIGKYLDILAKDPNSRVFAPLAEAYRKAGLLDDAIETALEGLNVHPNYLGGRVALGRAYFEKHQYAEAAAEMQKVVKAAADNIVAHKVLGQIHFAQGDLPSAERAFRTVLLLDPRDAEAKQFIANVGASAEPPPPAPAPAPRPAAVTPPAPATPSVAAPPPAPAPPEAVAPQEAAPPSLEGLPELAIEDFSLEPPEPAEPALAAPPAAPPAREEEMEFAIPGFEEPGLAPAPAPVSPAAQGPGGEMELEVFARMPWVDGRAEATPEPGVRATGPAVPSPEASAFEVFGRAKRGGPPVSTKGEQEAYQEIELEPTAHAAVDAGPEPESDTPFEVFTREPKGVPSPGGRAGHGVGGAFGEIEIETTAHALPESEPADLALEPPSPQGAPEAGEPGQDRILNLEEELPSIDLAGEIAQEPYGENVGEAAADVEVEAPFDEPVREHIRETTHVSHVTDVTDVTDVTEEVEEVEEVAGAFGEGEEVEEVAGAFEEGDEGEEVGGAFEEGEEGEEGDEGEDEEAAALEPGRGVFDTETLAAIYLKQGFHDRAAEIYRRVLSQRPGDAALQAKLDEVLALGRGDAPAAAPPPAPVVAPAAAPAEAPAEAPAVPDGREETLRRLNTLLEAFRGGARR